MSRKYNIAGIYIITQISTGKIYIGESKDIQTRWSAYKSLKTRYLRDLYKKPLERYSLIEQKIICNGIEDFRFDVIIDQFDDKNLINGSYRRATESYYIDKHNSTNINIGYNMKSKNSYNKTERKTKKGVPTTPAAKVFKSDPIIVYDLDDNSTMMFLGKASFGEYINKNRAIIARCVKNGKRTSHYLMYALDAETRRKNAENSIKRKLVPNILKMHGVSLAIQYIKGLEAVNEWCKTWGYDTIDVSYLYDLISEKENTK